MTNDIIKKLDDLAQEIIYWVKNNPINVEYYPKILDFYVRWAAIDDSIESFKYFHEKIRVVISENKNISRIYYEIWEEWIDKYQKEIITWILKQNNTK